MLIPLPGDSRLKVSAIALVALTFATAVTPAAAQDPNEIRFSGQTFGCFGENCTPGLFSASNYLQFAGMSFNQVSRPDGRTTLFLGQFSFAPLFQGETIIDSPFTLFIGFTNPTGIFPDPVYYTDIAGLVVRGKVNGQRVGSSDVSVVFQPNTQEYKFSGGQPDLPGRFTLELRDTYIGANTGGTIAGKITDATVTPEPISMVLMGSGLAGIAAARRRRKQKQQEV
jgi:hypothetical protein